MRELVPLTNAVAAKMLASALSGRGSFNAILADVPASVPTAADVAAAADAVNTHAFPATRSATEAKEASPASDRSREHHSAPWLLAAV
jgi:ribosomal protein L12E/L44/L45/RPP1/RPP2